MAKETRGLAGDPILVNIVFEIPTSSITSYNLVLGFSKNLFYASNSTNSSLVINNTVISSGTINTYDTLLNESVISEIKFSDVGVEMHSDLNVIEFNAYNPPYEKEYSTQDTITAKVIDSTGNTFAQGVFSTVSLGKVMPNLIALNLHKACQVIVGENTALSLLMIAPLPIFSNASKLVLQFPDIEFIDGNCTTDINKSKCIYIQSLHQFSITFETYISSYVEIEVDIKYLKRRLNAHPISNITVTYYIEGNVACISNALNIFVEPTSIKKAVFERGPNLLAGQVNGWCLSLYPYTDLTNRSYFIEVLIPKCIVAYHYPSTSTISLSIEHGNYSITIACSIFTEATRYHIVTPTFSIPYIAEKPIVIKAEAGFANPPYVINYVEPPVNYTESIHAYIGNQSYYIEGASENITIPQLLQPGILTLSNLTRSSNFYSDTVSLHFILQITSNSISKDSSITILLPHNFMYKRTNSDVKCFKNKDTPLQIITYIGSNECISNITIIGACNSGGCSINSSIDISITDVQNPLVDYEAILGVAFTTYDYIQVGDLQTLTYLPVDTAIFQLTNLKALSIFPLDDVLIYLNRPIAMQYTNATFVIYCNSTIPSATSIRITLPEQLLFENQTRRELSDSFNVVGLHNYHINAKFTVYGNNIITLSNLIAGNLESGVIGFKLNNIKVNTNASTIDSISVALINEQGSIYAKLSRYAQLNILQPSYECSGSCLECGGSSNYCTSCIVTSKFPLFYEGKCVSSCPSGYIDLANICAPCFDRNCSYCNSIDRHGCIECKPNYYNDNGECFMNCPLLTTPLNSNVCKSILECSYPCAACSSNLSFCISCGHSISNLNPTGKCGLKCDDGYYESNSICLKCHTSCNKCINSTMEGCTECSSLSNLYMMENKCVLMCGQHFYLDKSTRSCIGCSKECDSCSGSGHGQCISCLQDSPHAMFLHNGQCIEHCPVSYYRNMVTYRCDAPSGVIFVKPTVIAVILLAITSVIILALNALKIKENINSLGIVYALFGGVRFIDGILLSVYIIFVHHDAVNILLVVTMNFVPLVTAVNFYLSALESIYGHKYASPDITSYYAKYDGSISKMSWWCCIMGANGWRLLYSNMFNYQGFRLKVQYNYAYRYRLHIHTLVESTASLFAVGGCIYSLIVQDIHSYYFAHSVTHMLLNVLLLIFKILDWRELNELKRSHINE